MEVCDECVICIRVVESRERMIHLSANLIQFNSVRNRLIRYRFYSMGSPTNARTSE